MASFPYIAQYQQDDCGVTALQMVCLYHGKYISSTEARKACRVQFGEISFLGLSRGANFLGMDVLPLKLSAKELNSTVATPFIALIENQHYIVVYKFDASWVWIADPAIGRYKIPRIQFESSWLHKGRGFALFLKPNETWNPISDLTPKPEVDNNKVWKPQYDLRYYFTSLLEVVSLFFILQLLGYILERLPLTVLSVSSGIIFLAFVMLCAAWMILNSGWHHHFRQLAQNISLELRRYIQTDVHQFDTVEMAHDLLDQSRIEERIEARLGFHRNILLALFFILWISFQFPFAGLVSIILVLVILSVVIVQKLSFTGAYYWGFFRRDKLMIVNIFPGLFESNSSALDPGDTDQKPMPHVSLYPYTKVIIAGVFWFLTLLLTWQLYALSYALLFTLCLAGLGLLYTTGGAMKAIRSGFLKNLDQLGYEPPSELTLTEMDLTNDVISYVGAEDNRVREVTISPGKSTLILGPPKSGKSLLLQRIMGRNLEDGGMWLLDGKPVTIDQRSIIQSNILFVGHLVQSSLNQDVRENDKPHGPKWEALCARLGMMDTDIKTDNIERLPDQVLEYQQKLIALAVYQDPVILILDEPLKGMNPFNALIFMENLLVIRKGKTTILSSQFEEMVPLCDILIDINPKEE